MKPAVLRHKTGYQLNYDLPHHIYDTHVYPRKSSNGSTVIVYGHESGLRVIWYAGSKFKVARAEPTKDNGHDNDTEVIDLDSDGDDPTAKPVEFEDEDDEIDACAPYHSVLRHIDVPLGSPALRLAGPSSLSELSEDTPSILKNNIVVAVGCADHLLRIVAVPLDPPLLDVANVSRWGIQISKHFGHQDLVSAVAITCTSEDSEDGEEQEQDSTSTWSLLVASTSSTGSGLLLVHQLRCRGDKLSTVPAENRLIRRVNFRTPLDSAKLSFNTADPEVERHTNLLVTLPDVSSVKVYQVFPQRLSRRRGSAGTIDSISTTRSSHSASAGRFLATLLPGFRADDGHATQRQRVLDARWISAGRAVIALLEDGQFGIWDLEAAGPPTETTIKNQNNVVGVAGGGVTKFAASGMLERKRKSETNNGKDRPSIYLTGTISVRSSGSDDAVILCTGGVERYISSVATWWKNKTTGKGSLQPHDRLISLPSPRIAEEAIQSIEILPGFANEQKSTSLDSPPNFLVSTSSRLVVYVSPLVERHDADFTERDNEARPASAAQGFLERSDLDLDGVDRFLDDMQRSRPQSEQKIRQAQAQLSARPNFGSSMISHGEEGDMDLDSPLPHKISRFALAPGNNAAKTSRRLFS